jgi:hypothetical protein
MLTKIALPPPLKNIHSYYFKHRSMNEKKQWSHCFFTNNTKLDLIERELRRLSR